MNEAPKGCVWLAPLLLASPASASPQVVELAKLVASNPGFDDELGEAVAVSGSTILAGAQQADTQAGTNAGAAYVYEPDAADPPFRVVELAPGDAAAFDLFGCAVAIEGDRAVIGAYGDDEAGAQAGAAYVFERDPSGAWNEIAKLTASDPAASDNFGWSVALSGDTIAVGAAYADVAGESNAGAAYVFELGRGGPGVWGEVAKLTAGDPATDDFFGYSVAASGDAVAVGRPYDDPGLLIGDIGGLAFDPVTGTLYGADVGQDQLVSLDVQTGVGTPIGPLGYSQVDGLAFDPGTGTLFGTDTQYDVLITIDTATGAGTAVGPPGSLGFNQVRGLAFDPGTGTLFGADSFSDRLITIDTATGVGTAVGPLGFLGLRGLAFDPGSGTLHGFDNPTNQLVAIDTSTGAATAVGPPGFGLVFGLGFDPGTATLYGADSAAPGQLIEIEASTGVGSAIGTMSSFVANAGAVHVFERDQGGPGAWGAAGTLVASDAGSGDLFGWSVALSSGTALVGATGVDLPNAFKAGAAFVFERDQGGAGAWGQTGKLWAGDADGFDLFGYSVALSGDTAVIGADEDDHAPGTFTEEGSAYVFERDLGGAGAWGELAKLTASDAASFDNFGWSVGVSGGQVVAGAPRNDPAGLVDAGAAYLFDLSGPQAYCTAGTSASGCQALLTSVGVPSASAPSGFVLLSAAVEGAKSGLFYFGTAGPIAQPWGSTSSFKCVAFPTSRGALISGGGTQGACDGSFSYDLNARWQQKPSQNPGAGAVVQVQLWYRDPQSAGSPKTAFSDALELSVGP